MDEIVKDEYVSMKTEMIDEEFKIIGLHNCDSELNVESINEIFGQSLSKELNEDALETTPKLIRTDSTRKIKKSIMHTTTKVQATKSTQKSKLQQMDKSDQKEIDSKAHETTSCKLCNKNFRFLRCLKHHIKRSHSGPAICVVCFKTVKSIVHLKVHLKTHGGIKKHSCAYCDKNILKRSNLMVHERSHTGEKPYKCQYCDKKLANRNGLIVHERTHTGETPYKCQYCEEKCFTQRGALVGHERRHTNVVPYSCDFCGKGFDSKSILNSHKELCSA